MSPKSRRAHADAPGRMFRGFVACLLLMSISLVVRNDASGENLVGDRSFDRLFSELVSRWNGDLLWAPASMSDNIITRFGDEARAVFGTIPDGDCATGAVTIPLQVDGNLVDVVRKSSDGEGFEFEYRNAAGAVVKRTPYLAQCDKPSLAGDVSYCGLNSRMKRVVKGNVEWLFLCRKSQPSLEVEASAYWQSSSPQFARYGVIGFNNQTGEIVYFDGTKDIEQFDWSRKFPPPGGEGYGDRVKRQAAEKLYDPAFRVPCSSCHDNKSPYAITPYISMSRIGYGAEKLNPQRQAFSLGDYLPRRSRGENVPFRVIGTDYTATYKLEISRARTVRDPSGICTDCHTLTTQISGQRFAADALSQKPYASTREWSTTLELKAERTTLNRIDLHRTDWSKRAENGAHPWMPFPFTPGEASPRQAPDIEQWQALSNCLWGSGGDECGYRPLYSACAVPEGDQDKSAPTDFKLESTAPFTAGGRSYLRIQASWKYANDYGQVPGRDDIRFDVTVTESGSAGRLAGSSGTWLVQNLSYLGHTAYSDASETIAPRSYALDFPAQCGRTYQVKIVPKRFCFDQSGTVSGVKPHLFSITPDCRAE